MVSWDQHRVDAHQAKFTPPPQQPKERGVDIEGDLHDDIEKDLKARRWYYVHSRMDKPTTTQLGVTDFVIAIPEHAKVRGKIVWSHNEMDSPTVKFKTCKSCKGTGQKPQK